MIEPETIGPVQGRPAERAINQENENKAAQNKNLTAVWNPLPVRTVDDLPMTAVIHPPEKKDRHYQSQQHPDQRIGLPDHFDGNTEILRKIHGPGI